MYSKYLRCFILYSQKSRSNLLRSISNQIATCYFYNTFYSSFINVILYFSPKQNYLTFMLTTTFFHFLYGFVLSEKRQKQCTFKINCTGGFHLNLHQMHFDYFYNKLWKTEEWKSISLFPPSHSRLFKCMHLQL
jgi:hypothetical protein